MSDTFRPPFWYQHPRWAVRYRHVYAHVETLVDGQWVPLKDLPVDLDQPVPLSVSTVTVSTTDFPRFLRAWAEQPVQRS